MAITWAEIGRLENARDAAHAIDVWAASIQTYEEVLELGSLYFLSALLPPGAARTDAIGGDSASVVRDHIARFALRKWEYERKSRLVHDELQVAIQRIAEQARASGLAMDENDARIAIATRFHREPALEIADAIEKALRPRSITELPRKRRKE